MSVVINGKPETIPGITTISWLDPGGLRLDTADYRRRTTAWVRSLLLHATVGDEPQVILPGIGAAGLARRVIESWKHDPAHSGAHAVIDQNGWWWCCADLLLDATFHATTINEYSIGIELAQTRALELRQVQYDSLMVGLDWLTRRFRIQRQFHTPYRGSSRPVARLVAGGKDCVGIFGHRDQTNRRGKGDPGDEAFRRMAMLQYEGLDYERKGDITTWESRQLNLGFTGDDVDGVAGPGTWAALLKAGKPSGMWVSRPGD